MPHDNHVVDGHNLDVGFMSLDEARDLYLGLARDWKPSYPDPVVVEHEGVRVVRDDLIVGTKARAADLIMQKSDSDWFVYCQPRNGLAGISLIDAAKKLSKHVTLFMPACQRISEMQACCIERGVDGVSFLRVASMRNLNMEAASFALKAERKFIPMGLKVPLATAAIVATAVKIPAPEIAYVAISTGVLSRALQIAWPETKFISVAVARNLKAGELGRSEVISEPLPFNTPVKELPPFPSVATYDAKCWLHIPKNSSRDILFWNVGTEPILHDKTIIDRYEFHSNVSWKK